jgi:hypothetical protein
MLPLSHYLKGYKSRITISKKSEYFAFHVKVLSSGLYRGYGERIGRGFEGLHDGEG